MRFLKGISLLEFIVSIGILMILTFLGVLSYRSFIVGNQVDIRIKDYKSMIMYARLKALQNMQSLCLIPCPGKHWGACVQLMQEEQVIREWSWSQSKIDVTWTGLSSNRALCFHKQVEKNILNGHFNFQTMLFKKTMYLNRFGRIRVN